MARVRKMVSFPKDVRKKADSQKKALFALSIDTTPGKPPNGGLRTETMGLLAGPLASLLHTLADEWRRKYDKTVQGWLKEWGTPEGPALVFDNERARVGRTFDYVDLEVIDVEWMDGSKSKFSDTSLTKHKKLPSFQVSGPELWVPIVAFNTAGTQTGRISSDRSNAEEVPAEKPKTVQFLSFILSLDGGTEIQQHGPFESPEARDAEAKKMFKRDGQDDGFNVFGLDVPQVAGMHPTVFSFTNAFMEADDAAPEDLGDVALLDREPLVEYVLRHNLFKSEQVNHMSVEELRSECAKHQAAQRSVVEDTGEAAHWDRATCVEYIEEHELLAESEPNAMELNDLRVACSKHLALQGRTGT